MLTTKDRCRTACHSLLLSCFCFLILFCTKGPVQSSNTSTAHMSSKWRTPTNHKRNSTVRSRRFQTPSLSSSTEDPPVSELAEPSTSRLDRRPAAQTLNPQVTQSNAVAPESLRDLFSQNPSDSSDKSSSSSSAHQSPLSKTPLAVTSTTDLASIAELLDRFSSVKSTEPQRVKSTNPKLRGRVEQRDRIETPNQLPLEASGPVDQAKPTIEAQIRTHKRNIMPTKIRAFRGLKNGREDPAEFIEDIDWAYEQDHQMSEQNLGSEVAQKAFREKTYRILFRQNLDDKAAVLKL